MIASETDLYACGYKVYIPSPRSRPTSNIKRSDQKSKSAPTSSVSPRSSRPQKPKLPSPLYSQVKELSQTLAFSDDVVSAVSPHLVSYSKSKGVVKSLFQPTQLGIKCPTGTSNTVGRHDCRGEPKKHLPCHLVSPEEDQDWHKSLKSRYPKSKSRQNNHHPDEPTEDTNTTAKPGLYMVPSVKSVLWEDEILGKVSSSTARQLTGQPSYLSIDEQRLQNRTSLIRKTSTGIFSQLFSEDSVDEDELVSPPPRDYLSEYRDGARPVHQKMVDGSQLILDSGARFDKVVQDTFPYSPDEWCKRDIEKDEAAKVDNVRGYRKWLELPKPMQTTEDLHWQCRDISDLPERESSQLSLQPSLSQTPSQRFKNQDYFEIIHEWCSKWHIHLQLKDIGNEDSIIADMHNLCDTTRMIAVASVVLLAEQQAIAKFKSNLQLKKSYSSLSVRSQVRTLPEVTEHMIEELYRLLDDTADHVRVPSAIALYGMDKQNEKAEEVLLSAVSGAGHVESWASVQCLSCAGVYSVPVVEELVMHLQDKSLSRAGKASRLLASLSSKTGLVHCLLSEMLNCSGWLERLAACQILPKLHGGINNDVCHKLVHLAWNDWSPEVRNGAAKALGLTGHGKMIHDEINKRLTDDSETTRLDALKKLQSLNLMTAQLLTTYLSCFSDNHTSIRIQAVEMAGTLKLADQKVQDALLSLLVHDPSWKVKVYTLQAIAEIGDWNEALVKQLVWVVRFEKLASVRGEGCKTIARLKLKDERIIQTLRDLLTVEDDPTVMREVTATLEQLGFNTTPEDDMLETIRSEVKRLGTQETITAEVIGADRSNTTQCVIEGTTKPTLTTRDYLNYTVVRRQRGKVSSTHSPPIADSLPSLLTSTQSPNTLSVASTTSTFKHKPKITTQQSDHPEDKTSANTTANSQRNDDRSTNTTAVHTDLGVAKKPISQKTTTPPREEQRSSKPDKKVWTPDRGMIDNHLEMMRKRVSVPVDVLAS